MFKNDSTTYQPELIDNEILLSANENYLEHQGESKKTTQILISLCAGIKDEKNQNINGFKSIFPEFIDKDDFEDIVIPYYQMGQKIYASITESQQDILYRYLVEKKTLTNISIELNISPAGVSKHLKLIKNKIQKKICEINTSINLQRFI